MSRRLLVSQMLSLMPSTEEIVPQQPIPPKKPRLETSDLLMSVLANNSSRQVTTGIEDSINRVSIYDSNLSNLLFSGS